MAATPPRTTDVYERRAQIFPTLRAAQIARIARVGKRRSLPAGAILVEQGDLGVPFHVVLEGSIEVMHPSATGEIEITVHHAGGFTGETNVLMRRASLVRSRIREAATFLEVPPDDLRSILQSDAELSEIFMRAFILRRQGLLEQKHGDVVLIGSRHSADT